MWHVDSLGTLARWSASSASFPGIVAYMVWLERKVAARFQDRIGPNRVGPLGLLQPIADAIKLITKEDLVPRDADRLVHLAAPVLVIVSAFLVMAVIPFAINMAPVNLPSGMVYLIAVSSISPLGIFLAGWSSRNKYSLLGAMRSVAQLVSYEVPQVLSTIPIVLWAGSLSLVTIFDRQLEFGWCIFSPPGLLAFVILLIASIAEVNRTPFDLPEAESEIIAGYHTEYSGMRFGLFFLAEYLSVFAVSCLATALFLGGGTPIPFVEFPTNFLGETTFSYVLVDLILIPVFMGKVLFFIFLMFWIRVTLPRMRVDRLMNFAWKYLVPLAIVNILVAGVWYEIVIRPGFACSCGTGSGERSGRRSILIPAVWLVFWLNRRTAAECSARVGVADGGPDAARVDVVAARSALSWKLHPCSESRVVESGRRIHSVGVANVIQVLFVVIAAVGLAAALGTILARNLVRAALYLVAFFFTIACQFVLLEAEFLAALQVLVYIGAVAIILMFGIMLTRNIQGDDPASTPRPGSSRAGGRAAACSWCWPTGSATRRALGTQIVGDDRRAAPIDSARARPARRAAQAVNNMAKVVGDELMTRYVIAFEVAGLLLTAALVGAIAVAHREEVEPAPPRGARAGTA